MSRFDYGRVPTNLSDLLLTPRTATPAPAIDTRTPENIIQDCGRLATTYVPFGADYRTINSLFFFTQAETVRDRLNTSIQFFNAVFESKVYNPDQALPSAWQEAIFSGYEDEQRKNNQDYGYESFLAYVKKIGAQYLPSEYVPYGTATTTAELRFPSASIAGGRDVNEFAHRLLINHYGNAILASHVPHETASNITDEKAIQSYLDMLWRQNVTHVISLGGLSTRLPVWNYPAGNPFKTTRQEIDGKNIVTLTNTETNEQRNIVHNGFPVEDQNPLNLNNVDLSKFFATYDAYNSSVPTVVLMHCDSGVGRTGQGLEIIAVLNEYNADPAFKVICNRLQNLLLNEPTNRIEIQKHALIFFNHAANILSLNLRKVRYCIETQEQFNGALSQVILLLASKSKQLSHEQMAALRVNLNARESEHHDALAEDVLQIVSAPCSAAGSIRSHFDEQEERNVDNGDDNSVVVLGLSRTDSLVLAAAAERPFIARKRLPPHSTPDSSVDVSGSESSQSSLQSLLVPQGRLVTGGLFSSHSPDHRTPDRSRQISFAEDLDALAAHDLAHDATQPYHGDNTPTV